MHPKGVCGSRLADAAGPYGFLGAPQGPPDTTLCSLELSISMCRSISFW